MDKTVVKEFLDVKSLQQPHLKVEKDGTIVQVEPTITPHVHIIEGISIVSDPKCMTLLWQIQNDQVKLGRKVGEILDEMKVLRELVAGPITPASKSVLLHLLISLVI